MESIELTSLQITQLKNQDWFNGLIDDCKSTIVETGFTSRWIIIKGYHSLGKRISEEKENFDRAEIYGIKIVQCIAESIGKSERSVQYAVKFYEKYPDLSLLPEGKKYILVENLSEILTRAKRSGDSIRCIRENRKTKKA